MEYLDRLNFWKNSTFFDENTKKELDEITDENELKDRFYKSLEFGTGGLRGIIGAGDNRMNKYTVQKATQGLANYIKKNKEEGKEGVAIAYDSRKFSKEFSLYTAEVLAGNGIKTYIFDSLRPTPCLSFAVRELNCISGIVITASHNPPEYNGYKVYWSDGAQVSYPSDVQIIDEVNKIEDYENDIIRLSEKDALEQGLLEYIGEEIDEKYYKNVLDQIINKDMLKDSDIPVVYTPLHGTGRVPVMTVLNRLGLKNISIVKEQEMPDENFTTVGYPNPEDPKVFALGIEQAKKINATLVIATDPDADRVGVVVRDKDGEFKILTGNETGALIANYVCKQQKRLGTLPKNGALISTIVSTNLTEQIANNYGLQYFETLTGFKNIGKKILEFEKTKEYEYVFGFEESYGSLKGTYARDKDAVVASALIVEMACYYAKEGKTLLDAVEDLYQEYGYYLQTIESVNFKGVEGAESMKNILKSLRNNPPEKIADKEIVQVSDYLEQYTIDTKTNIKTPLDTEKSNVLYYTLDDNSWCCIRPSGTEPKIKIYFGVKDTTRKLATDKLNEVVKGMLTVFDKAKNDK